MTEGWHQYGRDFDDEGDDSWLCVACKGEFVEDDVQFADGSYLCRDCINAESLGVDRATVRKSIAAARAAGIVPERQLVSDVDGSLTSGYRDRPVPDPAPWVRSWYAHKNISLGSSRTTQFNRCNQRKQADSGGHH